MSHAKQVTITTISQDGVNTLLCPVLPIEAQTEAIRRVIATDSRITAEMQNLHKALLLKSGLMEDLLTGRVRVTSLL